jgi:hypothetical protein
VRCGEGGFGAVGHSSDSGAEGLASRGLKVRPDSDPKSGADASSQVISRTATIKRLLRKKG